MGAHSCMRAGAHSGIDNARGCAFSTPVLSAFPTFVAQVAGVCERIQGVIDIFELDGVDVRVSRSPPIEPSDLSQCGPRPVDVAMRGADLVRYSFVGEQERASGLFVGV